MAIGFVLGTLLMLLIKYLSRSYDQSENSNSTTALVVSVSVDVLLDGLLIGISFAAAATSGRLLTLALTVELLSLGLAVASKLGKCGASPFRIVSTSSAISVLVLVGAWAGILLLKDASQEVLELVLSFGLAALLFLVTEELLVEAHEEPETPLSTGIFFAGFLIFLILGMLE